MKKLNCTIIAVFLVLIGCESKKTNSTETTTPDSPHVVASSQIEAGRYLAVVSGCNDCHTHEYLMREGSVPEEEWFAGSPVGWHGPWGTTYASNLRLSVQNMTEDAWVSTLHTRKAMPPMPWFNTKNISDRDARAIYQYIKSLGVLGEAMPGALPPGEEPKTPYLSLFPQNLPQSAANK